MSAHHPAVPLVIFSHGNSFPGGTYSQLFKSLRARGYRVKAVDRFGHNPAYPVTSNWPHLVQELADFAAAEMAKAQSPAWLVGHSLGGVLSVMCAAKHPELGGQKIAGVLLLDSPLLTGWRSKLIAASKHTQLIKSVSPGRISSQRRNQWPSQAEALAQWSTKKVFSRWDPACLNDYVTHGTEVVSDTNGQTHCQLRFDRDVETQIYNTLPHNVDRLLRKHPLSCPVSFIAGTHSVEMRQVGAHFAQRIVGSAAPPRWQTIEGGHLFVFEKPKEAAQLALNALEAMAAI